MLRSDWLENSGWRILGSLLILSVLFTYDFQYVQSKCSDSRASRHCLRPVIYFYWFSERFEEVCKIQNVHDIPHLRDSVQSGINTDTKPVSDSPHSYCVTRQICSTVENYIDNSRPYLWHVRSGAACVGKVTTEPADLSWKVSVRRSTRSYQSLCHIPSGITDIEYWMSMLMLDEDT